MRNFPIRLDEALKSVPWSLLAPHEDQALANHGRTLEELAARGGLTPEEVVAIIKRRPWQQLPFAEARRELLELANFVDTSRREEISALIEGVSDLLNGLRDGKRVGCRAVYNRALLDLERAKGML